MVARKTTAQPRLDEDHRVRFRHTRRCRRRRARRNISNDSSRPPGRRGEEKNSTLSVSQRDGKPVPSQTFDAILRSRASIATESVVASYIREFIHSLGERISAPLSIVGGPPHP